MKFKPFNGKVIIKKIENEVKSSGGILLTNSTVDITCKAEIIAIADSLLTSNGLITLDMFKIGDVIMIGKNSGTELKIEDGTYHMIQISDILGKY